MNRNELVHWHRALEVIDRDNYEYEQTQRAFAKHSSRYWTASLWAWRVLFAILLVVLVIVAHDADGRTQQQPPRPTFNGEPLK